MVTMGDEEAVPEGPEDFESLTSEEEERLKDSFSDLEQRIERMERRDDAGHYALKNQKRLMYYLAELQRILEESLGVDVPDPPTLERPGEE